MDKDFHRINSLLDQIIEYNAYRDITNNSDKDGQSWNVHHLKLLKELITKYEKKI